MSFSRGTGYKYGASSPNFGRKVGTVLAFAAGGLIACASGFALLDPELPSARALAVATQSSSGEKAAPAVVTVAPAAEPAVPKQEPAVETKKPVPEAKEPVPETKQPIAETKLTTADPVKACPPNAADDRKADCDPGKAQKPDVVQAKTDAQAKRDAQAKSDLAAAVTRPSVPAAIAFERAPLITPPPAKPGMTKDSKTKSTDDVRPTKQAALPSGETPATDGARPSAEAPPAEAAPPAAEVAPAPVKPRKVVRTQSQRRSSYEDRYYRRHQNFFFPFFR